MNLAAVLVALYGLFSLIGGVIGYRKAKSTVSLAAGSVSGLILLVSAYGMVKGSSVAWVVSLTVALVLGVRFFRTWLKNRRLMPDLLMVLFSAATWIAVALEKFSTG